MKHYLILLTFLMLGISRQIAWSQTEEKSQNERPQFLLQEPVKFSGFGCPMYEYSLVQGDFNVATGGGGAFLINQQMFIGVYGLNSTNHDRLMVNGKQFAQAKTDFSHGGLWLGYIHQSHKLVHYSVSARIAGGDISLINEEEDRFGDEREIANDGVFVLTPQVEVELNVLKWMKLNAGLGYRAVSGVEVSTFNNADFSSLQGSFTLMFGWFNQ